MCGRSGYHKATARTKLATQSQHLSESFTSYFDDLLTLCEKIDPIRPKADRVWHVPQWIARRGRQPLCSANYRWLKRNRNHLSIAIGSSQTTYRICYLTATGSWYTGDSAEWQCLTRNHTPNRPRRADSIFCNTNNWSNRRFATLSKFHLSRARTGHVMRTYKQAFLTNIRRESS